MVLKKKLDKKIQKLDTWDIALTKLSVAAAVLFIIAVWPVARNWASEVNPLWFLLAAIVFATRPIVKILKG